jgi:Tfp pilus assembly protein PilV
MKQEMMPLNVATESVVSWSMTHRARSGRQGGFSLVEVTIAVGLFAFVMLPIIGLMSTGSGTMRRSTWSSSKS